jgi:glycosyltransferase involved in cell wall biosynthesis
MHIAIVTAGGAGMFCGSCMHDNAWARALMDAGVEVTLLPMYTPIRVDVPNNSSTRIFFGGINVYLDEYLPGWRYLPRWLTRPLDAPWLLRLVSQRGVSNNAAELGDITEDMLKGATGPQAREGTQMIDFLTQQLRPDIIVFSNIMLCGEIEQLKAKFGGRVLVTLQGDDVFLDRLVEPHRTRVFDRLRVIASLIDGFLVHSRFYADYMQRYLSTAQVNFHKLPLGIDCREHTGMPRPAGKPPTIGYFARITPEKGLRELVQAALLLKERGFDFRMVAGGYLHDQEYWEEVQQLTQPLGDRFHYAGSPDTLADKVGIYRQFDVLSVPAPYRDPKGLYLLEAWANGVPVVQPAHGHFPELITTTGGGITVTPNDPVALADGLQRMLTDEPFRLACAQAGWQAVRQQHDLPILAAASKSLFEGISLR